MTNSKPLACPYCGKRAERVNGDKIYPHRADLHQKTFWRCPGDCDAWVGCHPGTDTPLGRLANAELRQAKRRAHDAFDPLWKDRSGSKGKKLRGRSEAYAVLAGRLGIPAAECHIGLFTVELCERTIAICAEMRAEKC